MNHRCLTNFLETHLLDRDLGAAMVFSKYCKDMYVTSLSGDGVYIWNPTTKIWKSLTKDFTHQLISTYLRKACNTWQEILIDRKKTATDDLGKKIDEQILRTQRLYASLSMTNVLANIWKEVKPLIYDETFLDKLNNSDANFHYFPFGDKVVDLRTGEMKERTKEHYFSFYVDCLPDADPEKLKIVDNYMRNLSRGKYAEEMHFLRQELCGHFLSGHRPEKNLFICLGESDSGKSTLIEIMSKVMKEAYTTAHPDLLIKKGVQSAGSASPHIVDLNGKRMAAFNELEQDQVLNEASLKSLTSARDEQKGRELYKGLTSFHNHAGMIITSNFEPKVGTKKKPDQALIKRIKILPSYTRFVDEVENPEFDVLSNTELTDLMGDKNGYLPSVIHWCILGAMRWYQNKCKFNYPPICQAAKDEMVAGQDLVAQFMKEKLFKEEKAKRRESLTNQNYTHISKCSCKKKVLAINLWKRMPS